MSSITLASGRAMPLLGLGTWELRGAKCTDVVERALNMGYRHIDTAHMYQNQDAVGKGLKQSGIDREAVFVTTKIWHDSLRYHQVMVQFQTCLDLLQTDYVDLLLIHWPNEAVPLEETLRAFDEIQLSGRVHQIGVSNFSIEQVDQAIRLARTPVCTNQVQCHVGHFDQSLWQHCTKTGLVVTAYQPLALGTTANHATLAEIGAKQNKTAAQVALRWLVQRQIVAIPKASSEAHLRENRDVFSWTLTDEEMERIDQL